MKISRDLSARDLHRTGVVQAGVLIRALAPDLMSRMASEHHVRELASGQHGLVSKPMALAAGVAVHHIRVQTSRGLWVEIHPGVYYLNVTPMTWRSRVMAAVLAAGDEAVASHRTAALLLGLDGVFGSIVELTVPYGDRPVPSGVVVHRTRRPLPADFVESIPITAVERILLDLAWLLADRALEKVVSSAIRKGITTADKIDDAVRKFGGRGVKGTRKLRRVLQLVEADRTGSVAEVEFAQIVREAPIPTPVQQLELLLPNGMRCYPDFSWPDRQRLVEVDGFGAHSSPEQHEHDLDRQNMLMELGWEIRRFTAGQVRRHPELVRSDLIRFVNKPVL